MYVEEFNLLLREISQGSKNALEKIFKEFGKLVFSAGKFVLKEIYLAEDVVNDFLVKIWYESGKIGYIHKPKAWIYTVSKNIAKNYIVKRKEILVDTKLSEHITADFSFQEIEDNLDFFALIECLDEKERNIIVLRLHFSYKFKEISTETGIPLGTVLWKYKRAINKLKNNYIK